MYIEINNNIRFYQITKKYNKNRIVIIIEIK